MRTVNVAAYGQGIMYTSLDKYGEAIRKAGWDSIILAMLHPHEKGNIYFGRKQIIENGMYVGDNPNWPGQLQELLTGPGTSLYRLLAGVGGADVGDFGNIQRIYQNNKKSFAGTMLEKNFHEFHHTFKKAVTIIDMDVEDTYDVPSFVAFCRMLIKMGFGITFCPYICRDEFWIPSLKELNQSDPGAVKWWNLQVYAGGADNKPQQWADAISKAIPGFDTTGFIIPGDCSRNLDTRTDTWQGDCPSEVQDKFRSFKINNKIPPYLGGGFIWTIDQIIKYAEDHQSDPDPCHEVEMKDYIQAITAVLG